MLQFPKLSLGKAVFGACILFACAALTHVLAHEVHPAMPQSASVAVDEGSFLRENEAAMDKMMRDMAAKPTGDVDRDFVAMMVPHHQGAIDMAVIELRYGKNEQLRRIAQEIIVDQMQEIAAMKLAIGETVSASGPAPTQPGPAPRANEHDGVHGHARTDMPANLKQ
jgi:DUF305 family protein family protein